ncbi:MAG: hypothetical protein ACYT04_67010, partial [Nostoc sp.]
YQLYSLLRLLHLLQSREQLQMYPYQPKRPLPRLLLHQRLLQLDHQLYHQTILRRSRTIAAPTTGLLRNLKIAGCSAITSWKEDVKYFQ